MNEQPDEFFSTNVVTAYIEESKRAVNRLDLESKANPQQLQAILATDGPVLIIAGPGSGKTFTLVERIVYRREHAM
jgi:type II secretory ATPase GspE/PulE/Tfp pilus assembly ATPase PilB-like protein